MCVCVCVCVGIEIKKCKKKEYYKEYCIMYHDSMDKRSPSI